MYDAIVVGARCAGSPTAMLLARRGHRVLLVDRATFPSDTISTHIVWQPGVARLKRWGLLDQVVGSNCPPMRRITFDLGEFALAGTPPPTEDGVVDAYAPRRTVLDKILLDAAVAAGAEVREGFAVTEIATDGDRVTGLRGRSGSGSTVEEDARLVIGADGLHSLVARATGAPLYNEKPALACWYYTYWSGTAIEGPMLCPRDGYAAGAMLTNDGLACVPVAVAASDFATFRGDVEGNYLRTIERIPVLAERVLGGRREEPLRGMADIPNHFRRPYGPGWALVGDAGYHRDPVTAQGISDAFRDSDVLAEAVDAGLSGRRAIDDALADYERQRNEAVMPMYEFTCSLAALDTPPPEMQQLFGALRTNQDDADRFFGVMAGTVSIPEFYDPANVRRIMEGASR